MVLRSAQDGSYSTNNPLIKDLLPQVKKRLKKKEIKYPVLVTSGFHLVDADNDYGLSLQLTDQTQVAVVPEFDYKNNQRKFSVLDARGAPVFAEDGARTFYAKSSGLSRLYLDRDLDLGSDNDSLAYSYSGGRVVVEVGEANARKMLKDYNLRLAERRAGQEKAITERAEKAKARLDKGYGLALKEL